SFVSLASGIAPEASSCSRPGDESDKTWTLMSAASISAILFSPISQSLSRRLAKGLPDVVALSLRCRPGPSRKAGVTKCSSSVMVRMVAVYRETEATKNILCFKDGPSCLEARGWREFGMTCGRYCWAVNDGKGVGSQRCYAPTKKSQRRVRRGERGTMKGGAEKCSAASPSVANAEGSGGAPRAGQPAIREAAINYEGKLVLCSSGNCVRLR